MRTLTHYLRSIAQFGLGQTYRMAIELGGFGVCVPTRWPSGETPCGRIATARPLGTTAGGYRPGIDAISGRWPWLGHPLAELATERVAKRRV